MQNVAVEKDGITRLHFAAVTPIWWRAMQNVAVEKDGITRLHFAIDKFKLL